MVALSLQSFRTRPQVGFFNYNAAFRSPRCSDFAVDFPTTSASQRIPSPTGTLPPHSAITESRRRRLIIEVRIRPSSTPIQTDEYDAFGQVISESVTGGGDWPISMGYQSNWLDLGIKVPGVGVGGQDGRILVSQARLYADWLGRFLAKDPLPEISKVQIASEGNALGQWGIEPYLDDLLLLLDYMDSLDGEVPYALNLFEYAGNNPIFGVDPLGFKDVLCVNTKSGAFKTFPDKCPDNSCWRPATAEDRRRLREGKIGTHDPQPVQVQGGQQGGEQVVVPAEPSPKRKAVVTPSDGIEYGGWYILLPLTPSG